ncbi:hypothetical protein CBS63078_9778 [Aspergillus niger]|uniref:Uncharacterized protein n=1 Tax=Aspergillus niger TaxID=5061 RepID=A0A3F3RQ90_ASPNG|nr:response regulator [Aspergillus niger CBS 513.88]XP_025456493.1 response regulator [Aspergillus niger CBS 101883]KAI2822333.1 hypothetical protein CBS115989_2347 [Aspergillus niger]KAI2831429.1 hypothetical protein CBS133816_2344 [Aspergillus niger]KAI2835932.1 hypothetical protein CBS11350_9751 [Aspergillus niger]KAI2855603.1 hypothetical protein CBS11232_4363 [Aspergillus niger]KAI2857115.1 hypothetical protein CBS12448_6693 [Aspergillus niger]|eukprot:XP_001390348.2 response regulator [Aspergillus niger CBS 513.88]
MPDRRWAKLKAKLLLRRSSSTSSAPAATSDIIAENNPHDVHAQQSCAPEQLDESIANFPPARPISSNRRAISLQAVPQALKLRKEEDEEEEERQEEDDRASAAEGTRTSVIGPKGGRSRGSLEEEEKFEKLENCNFKSKSSSRPEPVAEQREGQRHSLLVPPGAGAGAGPSASRQRQHQQLDATTSCDRVRPAPCRRHSHGPFSEHVLSPPPTTLSPDLLPSPSPTPPPPVSDRGVVSPSFQFGHTQGLDRLGPTVGEPQLPVLDVVAENPTVEPEFQSSSNHTPAASFPKRPSLGSRRQSLLAPSHQHLINSLLDPGVTAEPETNGNGRSATYSTGMSRKIWVKRPGGSATLVPISLDSLVDELRDQVILKYSNSLGRTFDAPDIVIRITPRDGSNRQATPDRMLSPEEPLASVVDTYYPGGQAIEEALIIDIPSRRTPKPSPRHSVYYNHHHSEPGEHGEYFPLMPANPSVPTPPTHPSNSSASVNAHPAPSISILTTGMAPPLPSPGSRGTRHPRRPPLTRHATNSPTILNQAPTAKDPGIVPSSIPPQPAPSIPTPPGPPPESPQAKSLTPPARGASPRPRPSTSSAKPKKTSAAQSLSGVFGGLIEGTVPPINVLIVEDNNINQRLLEAFMKRLSVRWKCAANGEEAVNKWRQGGFHLVLMDIQLPVMNGLDATKEIRRLERLNGVGVFPKTADGRSSAATANAASPSAIVGSREPLKAEDTLHDLSLFKSPVIIVALTASSLQSDRHEALAAGCNDFLTKPVRFEWLEQKVTEWGCMQALIDFEGWRKWRGYADDTQPSPTSDGHTSPMQTGGDGTSRKQSPVIPLSPSSTLSQGATKKDRKTPSFPKPIDVTPEDSSGSGSGEGLDSPASPVTSVPVPDGPADPDAL